MASLVTFASAQASPYVWMYHVVLQSKFDPQKAPAVWQPHVMSSDSRKVRHIYPLKLGITSHGARNKSLVTWRCPCRFLYQGISCFGTQSTIFLFDLEKKLNGILIM